MEIDTKAVEERYSETEPDLLQDHPSRLEGDHQNVEDMDKKTSEMYRDNRENKFNNLAALIKNGMENKQEGFETEITNPCLLPNPHSDPEFEFHIPEKDLHEVQAWAP